MAWFSPLSNEVVSLTPEEIQPDPAPSRSLLDHGRTSVGEALEKLRGSETSLVDEIADRTERLRQTRVAIEAFEAAEKIMVAGDHDFAEVEPVQMRGHTAEFAAADLVVENGKDIKSRNGEVAA